MRATRFSLYFGISLLLLAFDYFGLLTIVKDPLGIIPITSKRIVYGTSRALRDAGSLIITYPQMGAVVKENNRLKSDIAQMEEKLKETADENTILRKQLEAPLSPSYTYIPAHVVSVSRFMEIDQGENSGIAKDMTVVDGSVYIGKVTTVAANRSQIMLPDDANSRIPAKTSRGTRGFVGGVSGVTTLVSVLQKDPLFQDDTVVTSGEEGEVPNLLIGKITFIQSDDSSVYKQATVAPTINNKGETIVFAVKTQ